MLAETVDIENADGIHTFSLNADTGGPGPGSPFSPLNDFDVEKEDRSNASRHKMQQSGSWPTRSYEGSMSMHIEGELYADTLDDFWVARQNLLVAIFGVPGANIVQFKRGTLFVKPQGYTERWKADYGPATVSDPIRANKMGCDLLITLVSFTPWFIGETSGNKYWWS